jgi:ribonuclease HII
MAVVKGDSRVAEISAASILAKVTRDAEMAALDLTFPQYGLPSKGYPTAFHLESWLNMAQPNITGAVLAR